MKIVGLIIGLILGAVIGNILFNSPSTQGGIIVAGCIIGYIAGGYGRGRRTPTVRSTSSSQNSRVTADVESGSIGTQAKSIVGKWETTVASIRGYWIFSNNGAFEFSENSPTSGTNTMRGNYSFDGSKIMATVPGKGTSIFIVSNLDGNKLTMAAQSGGRMSAPVTLTKKG